jgi:hypothetical protein
MSHWAADPVAFWNEQVEPVLAQCVTENSFQNAALAYVSALGAGGHLEELHQLLAGLRRRFRVLKTSSHVCSPTARPSAWRAHNRPPHMQQAGRDGLLTGVHKDLVHTLQLQFVNCVGASNVPCAFPRTTLMQIYKADLPHLCYTLSSPSSGPRAATNPIPF